MHRPQDDVVPLHEPFETALRGFNRQQVLAHIESLDGHISMVSADRESALAQVAELSRILDHLREESQALAQLRQATAAVDEQAQRMQKSPMFAASARVQRIIQLAEEEAAELMARTEREVAERRERAINEAETLLQDTAHRCKQLEADSEQRCKEAEQDAERKIAQREIEANARIQHNEQRSIANLQILLGIIGPQLLARMAEIKRQEARLAELRDRTGREVGALEAFRDDLTAQLSATRQLLTDALDQVQQTHIEYPEPGTPPVPAQRDRYPDGTDDARRAEAATGAGARAGLEGHKSPAASC